MGGRFAPAIGGLLAWAVLVGPVLSPSLQLAHRDTSRLFYPVKKTIADALLQARLPLWDPWIEGGSPILGQVSPALLHPFTLLYLPLPFDLAFKLNHLLALLLAGFGAWSLARRAGVSPWGALVAAIAYGGGGPLVSAAACNLPLALGGAAMPLALAGLSWLWESPRPVRLLLSAAALALCAFGGDPQSFGITLFLGCAWTVARPLSELRRLRLMAMRAGLTAGWAACALVLSAPVLLPGLAQWSRSERRAGLTTSDLGKFALDPNRLPGLLLPFGFDATEPDPPGTRNDPFSEYFSATSSAPFFDSITLGVPALLLAALASRRKSWPLWVGAIALVAASTGDSAFVQPLLLRVVPGWEMFRYAEKLLVPASCLLAIAAGLGADQVLRGSPGQARRLVMAGAGLAGCLALAWLSTLLWRDALVESVRKAGRVGFPEAAERFVSALGSGLAVSAALAAGMALVGRYRMARPGLPDLPTAVAAAAVLGALIMAPPFNPASVELFHGQSATGERLLAQAGPSQARWRVWVNPNHPLQTSADLEPHAARLLSLRESLFPQLQSLDGIEGLAPYFSIRDAHFALALREAPKATFKLFGVRWALAPDDNSESEPGPRFVELPLQPRAVIVHSARVYSAADAVAAMAEPSFDPHREVILPLGAQPLDGPVPSASEIVLHRASPERMSARVAAAAEGVVVIAEHFDPGWRATVDGVPAEVLEADLSALAVRVPAGGHLVELRYIPVGLLPGLACCAALVLLLSSLEVARRFTWWRRRQVRVPPAGG